MSRAQLESAPIAVGGRLRASHAREAIAALEQQRQPHFGPGLGAELRFERLGARILPLGLAAGAVESAAHSRRIAGAPEQAPIHLGGCARITGVKLERATEPERQHDAFGALARGLKPRLVNGGK